MSCVLIDALVSSKYKSVILTEPRVESLSILKSLIRADAIEDDNENIVFNAGQARPCVNRMPGFDALPAHL